MIYKHVGSYSRNQGSVGPSRKEAGFDALHLDLAEALLQYIHATSPKGLQVLGRDHVGEIRKEARNLAVEVLQGNRNPSVLEKGR